MLSRFFSWINFKNTSFQNTSLLWIVIFIDQVSKAFANAQGWVTLNKGISFGMGSELVSNERLISFIFAVFLLVMVLAVGVWLWKEQGFSLGLQLFLGGAISNILDRFLFGGVRDWMPIPFLDLHNNIADYCVVIGLVMVMFLSKKKSLQLGL